MSSSGAQALSTQSPQGRVTTSTDYTQFVALIVTYNEGDIIRHSLRRLIDQGIGVYLIDNWSTDDTEEQIKPLLGRGIIGYEKFPPDGPSPYFSLVAQLERKEQLAQSLSARWLIHMDVDEVRESPWPGLSLREGLERVEQEGYNCVNHVVLRFRPIDNGFRYGTNVDQYMQHFSFERHPAYFEQKKAWLRTQAKVSLAPTGGHSVSFPDQRIYPVPFLLKHYPIRSQAHGQKKILRERKTRFDPLERAGGWHTHYDYVTEQTDFIAAPANLDRYDPVETRNSLLRHPLTVDPSASFE